MENEQVQTNEEHWMTKMWRPAMGWLYMVICLFDMLIFPILWSLLQAFTKQPITQWNPLTLQGAGLFHIAMGAVLGISAFGRTQEKLNGASMASAAVPPTPVPVVSSPSTIIKPVSPVTSSINTKATVPTTQQPEL